RRARCCHSQSRWKGRPFFQTHGCSAFEIRANQERKLGATLQLIGDRRGGIGFAPDNAKRRTLRFHNEAAHMKFFDSSLDLRIRGAVRGEEAAVVGGEEELTNLLVKGHAAEALLYPFLVTRTH